VSYCSAIFDFDGTLANSFASFIRALNHAADKYTFRRVGEQEIEVLRQLDAIKALQYLGVSKHKLPRISQHIRRHMAKDINQIALFDGTDLLLEKLAGRGVTLSIVSANRSANVRQILGPRNGAYIHHFACGAAFLGKQFKIRQLVRRSSFDSPQHLLIGDQISDLLAARAENIRFGAVSWGFNSGEALMRYSPDFEFNSMDEILEKVPWCNM
jgi:phosphoglycolate phosphatase